MASSSPARKEPNRFSALEETTQRPPPAPDEMATRSPNPDSSNQPQHAQLHWPSEQDEGEPVLQPSLPLALLMDIAEAVDNREWCIRLAVKLKLGEDELLKVLAEEFSVQVPLDVLSTWKDRYRHHATGPVLHAAFCEMERVDLADRFKDKLLGQSDVPAQSAMEMMTPLQSAVTEETDISQMKPSLDVLVEIAFSLPKLKHCVRLAESFQLGAKFVEQLKTGVFKVDTAALNVLCRWRQQRSREVTSKALYDALIAIRRRDIAACCAGHLLGREEDGWEDFCFDDEHRNFFQTLRQRQINVVGVYEGMYCSEDFLSCLHRWHILERSEYEDLLSSSCRLLRSTMNKRLLNVVNRKPSRLQEVFTELLCRNQPHLLKKHEEGSSVLSGIKDDYNQDGTVRVSTSAEATASQCAADTSDQGPEVSRPVSAKAIAKVAQDIPNQKKCIDLVSQLGFGHIRALKVANFDPDGMTAQRILNDWVAKKGKQATGQELFDALVAIDLKIVAEEHKDLLLGEGDSHHLTGGVLVDSPWQLCGENLLVDFKNELNRQFNWLVMARPLDFIACGDSQPVSEVYVTLSSISYEEALKLVGGPKELCGSELLKAASQVAAESEHSKELLDLHSLLRYPQGMQAKSALLFGSAGSGKSLTVLKILSEWNSQNFASPFQQFDVIIHITGRERSRLNAKEVHDLWQLWQMGYSEQQQEFIITHYAHHSEKVLFLVDAWDEAGEEGLLGEDTVLKKILRGNLFRQSSVIITSRPAPNAYPLLEDCKRRYSLVGFNNKRLRELFDRRLEEPHALRLYEALSQSSYLHVKSAVQKTPLFAAMLVQLNKMEETLPITITDLYQSMLACIRCRYVQWVKDTRFGSQGKAMTFDENSTTADFDQVETRLGKLALAGWMSNKVSFTEEEASSCGKMAMRPEFGLLSEVQEIGVHGNRVLYHFNHLTWQEYLAACSLTADPQFIKKLRLCVRSVGVGEHTQLFWRFVTGLVDSHLVPTMVLEVVKATGIAGFAPWETEVCLFLLECIAEHIRMRDLSVQQLVTTQYIQLAAEVLAVGNGQFKFSGCVLDANRLSALALVLRFCANIQNLAIHGIHVDHHCPSLATALDHLTKLSVVNISGPEASSFLTAIFSSLASSSSISLLECGEITFTRESLSAFAQLINNCKSLSLVRVSRCDFGLPSIAFLNRTIRQSSALSELTLEIEMLAGAGRELGEICSRMPQLQILQISQIRLGNSDLADLLAGLQNSCYLQCLIVTSNLLTDDVAVPLVQFAARRAYLAEQVRELFQVNLPELDVDVADNQLSEDMLRNLAVLLPEKCLMSIAGNQLVVEPGSIWQRDHALTLKKEMDSSPDGHVEFIYPGTGDLGAVQIAQFLTTGYGQLTSLMLSRCDFGDHGAATIAGVISSTRLQGLDISHNHITSIGFYQLMSALTGQDTLTSLKLCCNPIFASCGLLQSQWMPSILSLSLSIPCLKIVSMGSTKFSDEMDCFENSPLALMAIPSLSALDLSNNDITDRSVPMVTEWMDKLEYLSLSGNRITSKGGRKLMERAQVLTKKISGHQMSACRLQRIWLGRNDIEPSVLADCRCAAISSESFSLDDIRPRFLHDLLSSRSAAGSIHYSKQLPLGMSQQCVHLKFWLRMNRVVQWDVFLHCMEHIIQSHDKVAFNLWLRVVIEALANADGSSEPEHQADVLHNVFVLLVKWYKVEENMPMVMAIDCCRLAIMDEMVLTCSNSVCKPTADQAMEFIAECCSLDSDILRLAVEYLSGLAERYRRRHLYSVADKLLQRLECVSQYAWGVMQSSFY